MSWAFPETLWYPPRCELPHVPSPTSHCERLGWRRGVSPGRPIRRTCGCLSIVYELVEVGTGDFVRCFIRRTSRVRGEPVMHESEAWGVAGADEKWNALLFGHVL